MPLPSRYLIAQKSRDRTFLLRTSIWIVGISVVLGLLLSVLIPKPERAADMSLEDLEELVTKMTVSLHQSEEKEAVMDAWKELDREKVLSLFEEKRYRDAFTPNERLAIRTDIRDFRGLAVDTALREWRLLISPYTIPAIFTAAIWFLILMPFWEITRTRMIACLVAFALGIVSAGLTIYAFMLQERMQGFVENPDDSVLSQFIYWIAGVALREETLKLLCFIPVAIWASRRKNDVEGMILAAMVGLGFAFQENIGYFARGLDDYQSVSRLVSANPLHFCVTGLTGFYFYRMLVRKFHGMEEFLFSFIAVVVVHGIYNAMISMPALNGMGFFSMLLVAGLAYQFFDPLRSKMDVVGSGQRVSPLGVFVLGIASLTCVILVYSSTYLPFSDALANFLYGIGSTIPIAFAFINRFREL